MSKVLFLHGLESMPGGVKPKHLRDLGYEVIDPGLPKGNFEESVEIAQLEIDAEYPDVVVGSSRGGAVAMALDLKGAKLVLIAPAWRKFDVPPNVPPGTTILHCPTDNVVYIEDSEELMSNPGIEVIRCGAGHRMGDSDALEQLRYAVEGSSGHFSKNTK